MDPLTLGLIFGGSALAQGALGYYGSNKAAGTAADAQMEAARLQAEAQNRAMVIQQQQYDQSRADMAPFLGMQRQAWEQYMRMAMNPDFAGLDAMGARERANTGAYFAKSTGGLNNAAHYQAQEMVGQQLAMEKARMKMSAFSPFLNLGAPSQQAALAAQFGQGQAGLLQQGAQLQGGYMAGAGQERAQGQMGGYQAGQNFLGALGTYAGYAGLKQGPSGPFGLGG